jgi:hypothetical protein
MHFSLTLPILLLLLSQCAAGPLAFGTCQTACNIGAAACYAASGLTFGAVTLGSAATGPVGWWAWLTGAGSATTAAAAACSSAQGLCMSACTPLLVAPTP